ncbi:MAG: alpha/beta hydrolase-fold protein [Planctomycetota bacterium]|nr:alpha/beta hydrolase-fold protein [Planctomycetota bacterium]
MLKILRTLILTILALFSFHPSEAGQKVSLRFVVTAPEGTKSKTLKIVGNHASIGAWKVKNALVLNLDPKRPGVYTAELKIGVGETLEFKVVRDAWTNVEKSAAGGEIRNRKVKVTKAETLPFAVARWADKGPPTSPEAHITFLGNFGKASLDRDRPVWVHRPEGYKKSRSYPVLYMLDGQNVFDPSTSAFGEEWGADEAHDQLLKAGKIIPVVIVAIGNSAGRMYEYTPDKDPKYGSGGGLHKLEMMIQQEIEPALRKKYSIKKGAKNRGIMGSSLGGLAAFHLALRHPDRYGVVGVISPSFWWNKRSTLAALKKMKKLKRARKMWMDMGTKEGDGVTPIRDLKDVAALLRKKGYKSSELKIFIDKNATHSEPSWRKRLPRALSYLYESKSK